MIAGWDMRKINGDCKFAVNTLLAVVVPFCTSALTSHDYGALKVRFVSLFYFFYNFSYGCF